MTIAPFRNDPIETDINQAARCIARAVGALRDQGDNEYAAILQAHLHGLHRPHWLTTNAPEPVLPVLNQPRLHRKAHAYQ